MPFITLLGGGMKAETFRNASLIHSRPVFTTLQSRSPCPRLSND